MVTRVGDRIILDNLRLGAARSDEDPDIVYMVFTDVDNEEMYLVPIATAKVDDYFQVVKKAALASQIEIAGENDMPRPQR